MLRSLSLAECGLGPAGAGALVRSRSLARLSDLDLSGNVLGPVVAEHLAGVMSLRLDRLNLENCELGDRGVRLLASWPGLANLRRLSLPCNGISDSGAEALAASPYLGRLAVLDLGGNDLSREAEERLQRAPSLRHLWRLETFPF
jgi:Ran GTPase-activating protein (RanGAP) involved in mRNA processing and transport